MDVKLISVTKPLDGATPEELIVGIARVSSSRKDKYENYSKLLNYLIKHKHWSPFEMIDLTFEITTNRAISHELIRHRSFSFQEFSQRYSKDIKFEEIEFRKQCENNRQSSTEHYTTDDIENKKHDFIEKCNNFYNELISKGVARETARMILPNATQTTIYMKGSLRSWIHFLEVRDSPDAQKEIQLIARAIKNIIIKEFPVVSAALEYSE